MSNTIRIKRRNASGAAGAPSSLQQAELAFNEADGNLMIGVGTGGVGGTATTIAVIGGTNHATKSYVDSAVSSVNVSSQLANYLTTANAASTYLTQSSASSTYLTQSSASSTYLTQSSASSTYLTQANAASTYATPSYVATQISDVIGAAPSALNTLKELADALGSDAAFSTTVTNSLAGKLTTANNLSELTATASTARTNLGLGSMATQAANNVNITGGSIDGVTLDGGTF